MATTANIAEYIRTHFDQSDLSAVESRIASRHGLRFELGHGLANGTKARVDQSVSRATAIFEAIFRQDDEAWVLVKSWAYRGEVRELWAETPRYLEDQFRGFDAVEKLLSCETIEEFSDALHEDGVERMTDFTTTHIQTIFCQGVAEISYLNIFRGIANREMGLQPTVGRTVYFINTRSATVLHMYDDRGCDVFAEADKTLIPIREKFGKWLVAPPGG